MPTFTYRSLSRTGVCWASALSSVAALYSPPVHATPDEAGSVTLRTNTSSEQVGAEATSSHAPPLPTTAAPDGPVAPERGFQWGLELGLELPLGKADQGVSVAGQQGRSGSLEGIAAFRVPVALDLGYRTSPAWWFGLEASAGLGPAGSDCEGDANCEWSSVRLGAQALHYFSTDPSSALWLSAIVGYEWLRGSVTQVIDVQNGAGEREGFALKASEYLTGPLLALQGGWEFTIDQQLRLGPYLSAAGGAYLTDGFDCRAPLTCPADGAVDDPSLHVWLGLGVRGSHGP